ncbi:protein of unknown function [Acidithiobacillus ferrivorans]|nr:protein of unknown function [Acidithiobacillus ferrivorans]
MALLKAVQHVSYGYEQGHFQTAVAQVSAWHRLAVLIAAGLLATFMVWLLRKLSHGANSDIVGVCQGSCRVSHFLNGHFILPLRVQIYRTDGCPIACAA